MEILFGLGGVGILYWAYSKYKGTGSTTPVYVSPASWAAIAADTNRIPAGGYREPDPTPDSGHPEGEWDPMAGTFGTSFPGAFSNPVPAGIVPADAILSWFKGLNINPVRNQNYANLYKADIQAAYNAGLLKNRATINIGDYVIKQGLTPLPGAYAQKYVYGSGAGAWAGRAGNGISGFKNSGLDQVDYLG